MNGRAARRLLTIGQLSELTGVPVRRRIDRFWELVAVVGGRPAPASMGALSFESMEWLVKALRAAL